MDLQSQSDQLFCQQSSLILHHNKYTGFHVANTSILPTSWQGLFGDQYPPLIYLRSVGDHDYSNIKLDNSNPVKQSAIRPLFFSISQYLNDVAALLAVIAI